MLEKNMMEVYNYSWDCLYDDNEDCFEKMEKNRMEIYDHSLDCHYDDKEEFFESHIFRKNKKSKFSRTNAFLITHLYSKSDYSKIYELLTKEKING